VFAEGLAQRWRPTSPLRWIGLLATLAIIVPLAAAQIAASISRIPTLPGDVDAYWQAAVRLRGGGELYLPAADVLSVEVYRYAPWFAWTWVPLTYLPREAVGVAWRALMVVATVAAVVPLVRRPSIAALIGALLIVWLTLQTALFGNVQPLIVAALVWGADRRSGPLWIGLAASLKFIPLLYVLVYLVRREWMRAALTIGVAAVLVAPMLAFDLSAYTVTPGESASLYHVSPLLWAAIACAAAVLAVLVMRLRPQAAWLAASVAVVLAYPQAHLSYASHLLVGTRGD
jgi:alpha-1,2-mannosyltransferase